MFVLHYTYIIKKKTSITNIMYRKKEIMKQERAILKTLIAMLS